MRQEGWINDLNGLIYYDGEYHLFAQRWAKCWLHAVSRDLIHWTELDPAFWEEKLDSGVQSGTCVIDYKNTSGLSPNLATPPMIAFWPRFDNHSQCLSYSLDHGRTWKPYDKNPILDYPERDPKVFWYGPGNHWVMILYGNGAYHILNSTNLLNWTDTHHAIPNSFECPDFFELTVDGNQMPANSDRGTTKLGPHPGRKRTILHRHFRRRRIQGGNPAFPVRCRPKFLRDTELGQYRHRRWPPNSGGVDARRNLSRHAV